MLQRKSDIFIFYVVANILILCIFFTHTLIEQKKALSLLDHRISMVDDLKITDLSLFTDARYTRHPSMADLNTAFQDHPLSLEHFPSGTLLAPPRHLKRNGLD